MGNAIASRFGNLLRELQCEECLSNPSSPNLRIWYLELLRGVAPPTVEEAENRRSGADLSTADASFVGELLDMLVKVKREYRLPLCLFGLELRLGATKVRTFQVNCSESTSESGKHDESTHFYQKYVITFDPRSIERNEASSEAVLLQSIQVTYDRVCASDLCVGDHIFFQDDEGTNNVMSHHLVVVSKTRCSSSVQCVGLQHRTRWKFTFVSLLHLASMISRVDGASTLSSSETSGVSQSTTSHNVLPREQQPLRLHSDLTVFRVSYVFNVSAPDTSLPSPGAPFPYQGIARVQRALACVGLHRCWSGASFNCEDFGHWVCTGLAFSIQRMRGVLR